MHEGEYRITSDNSDSHLGRAWLIECATMDENRRNLELKSYCDDVDAVRAAAARLGALSGGRTEQSDVYFNVSRGRLKLRTTKRAESAECALIACARANDASLRSSDFVVLSLDATHVEPVRAALEMSCGVSWCVTKLRERLQSEDFLVNLDELDGVGRFFELEVFEDKIGRHRAEQVAATFRRLLRLGDELIIPWSYAQLANMYAVAKVHRTSLAEAPRPGRLFLLDGPSGSGKTTIVDELQKRPVALRLQFVKRYTTRPPRFEGDDEYAFISRQQFDDMRDDGKFIDAKDFLFSMSYGVAWSDVMPVLLAGKSVFAPLNWGNAAHVKRLFPEAVVIQVTADEADLRRRLGSRGVHDKDQLDERIGNALRFSGSSRFADLLIDNRDGTLAGNIQAVEDFIAATVA